jgi:thioredoxin 1
MTTMKVSDSSWDQDVLKSSQPVVVDFWAEWCGPCRAISKTLEDLATEMAGKLKIVKLNVDENPKVTTDYGIRSIPTLILFKDGKEAGKKVGVTTDLASWIRQAAA